MEREHAERKIGTISVRVAYAGKIPTFPDSEQYRFRYKVIIRSGDGHNTFTDPDGVRAINGERVDVDTAFRLVVGYLKTVAEAPPGTFGLFAGWVDQAARRNRAALTTLYNELAGIEQ